MNAVVVILIIIVAVVVVVLRRVEERTEGLIPPERPLPVVNDFRVEGDTAVTVFAVPLGDSVPGEYLIDLLGASAIKDLRGRGDDGLELGDVEHIEISAMRGGVPEILCVIDLPSPGVLPDLDEGILNEPLEDTVSAVQASVADSDALPQPGEISGLEPLNELINLSDAIDANLRSVGVDTGEMSLNELVLGLLRLEGYEVRPGVSGQTEEMGGRADTYSLTRQGKRSFLIILNHEDGSYPELDDSVLARFAVEVTRRRPEMALLVTDKYSPYSMYERERRDGRSLYVTRERLQAFVDTFGPA